MASVKPVGPAPAISTSNILLSNTIGFWPPQYKPKRDSMPVIAAERKGMLVASSVKPVLGIRKETPVSETTIACR